ncbi:MAG TPA: hypothetical protein ENK18_24135, partial [Deltaproteobacteria bacterium]|nr:hypothetical protein [Deltaproteobacteria bacterium]
MGTRLRLQDGYIDLERCCVVRAGIGEVSLTPTEHRLITYLAKRVGQAVGIEELAREVWGYAPGVRSRAPYVAIQRLRTKIERSPGAPTCLVSVHGTGYRLDLVESAGPGPADRSTGPTAFVGRSSDEEALAGAWAAGHRLVVLRGPAGIGKTRLMQEHLRAGAPGL